MPSLVKHYWRCIEVVCAGVNRGTKMTYGELANSLALKLARQEREGLLDLVAGKMTREIGCDLTWNIVYAGGPAKGLGRYFSNGDKEPGSTILDPKYLKQVAEYERTLQHIYQFTYHLQNVDGADRIIKQPR
jgi:hypothetical protein